MVERKHHSKTEDFNEAQAKYPHLRRYVNKVSQDLGVPEFKIQLDRSLRTVKSPNIIYPVGDPIFIHIKREDSAIIYNVIIPELTQQETEAYNAILERIIEVAHTAKVPNTQDELRDVLISLYNEVVKISQPPEKPNILNFLGKKITVTESQYHNILFHLLKDRLGYAKLEPLLRDIYIEDISCVGIGAVWIVHKIFGSIRTSIIFDNDIELNKYIVETSERVERPVSEATPIVDAIMPDGSRANFIYSRKISLEGSSFTIRKFNETPISGCNLVKWGTWSSQLAAYLWLCLENGISIFVCGETASGKTTTLNASTAFIPYDFKCYTVEQTPEITLPHPIWQHLVTRESGEKTDVTMFDLLIASLRSRPDYIIVGEIRGKEANITFQAMQCIREGNVFLENLGHVDIKHLFEEYKHYYGTKKDSDKQTVEIPKHERETLPVSKKDGKIFTSKISHIHEMKKQQLIKVTFSNGEELEVTPKHKFILEKNKEITAQQLMEKDLIQQNISILNSSSENRKDISLNLYELIHGFNVKKTQEYYKLEEKFKQSSKYRDLTKSQKYYCTQRSKTVSFEIFKQVYEYFGKPLPNSLTVVLKGHKTTISLKSEITKQQLISIAHFIVGKSVSKQQELFIKKILKISEKSLGNLIFSLSKSQISTIVEEINNLTSAKQKSVPDSIWYSLGRLAGDDSLYITKNKTIKDFRWQIKNANKQEGLKYAQDAKKIIPHSAISTPTNQNGKTYTTRICNIDPSFIDFLVKNQFISLPNQEKFKYSKAVTKRIPINNIGNIYAYIAGLLDSDASISKKSKGNEITFALNINRDEETLMKDQLNLIKTYENTLFPNVLCVEFRYNSKYEEYVKDYEKYCRKLGFKVRTKIYDKANGIGARVEFSTKKSQNVFDEWNKHIINYMYRDDKIATIKSLSHQKFQTKKQKNNVLSYRDLSTHNHCRKELLPDLSLLAKIAGEQLITDNISYYDKKSFYFTKNTPIQVLDAKKSVEDVTYDITMEDGKYYMGGKYSHNYIYDTGHPVISTFHAGSVHSMIQRLTGDPINIPIAFIDNLNVIVIQSAVYVNGKVERRVLSVTEIIKYNDEVGRVLTKEVFQWDSIKDEHMFRGLYNSYILEQKIAHHMGLKDSREIYDIMSRRTKIIDKFIENDILDYFKIVKILKEYRQDGEGSLPFSL